MLEGFQMKKWELTLHEQEHLHLTQLLRVINNEQVSVCNRGKINAQFLI